jgi:hypothetical protein
VVLTSLDLIVRVKRNPIQLKRPMKLNTAMRTKQTAMCALLTVFSLFLSQFADSLTKSAETLADLLK